MTKGNKKANVETIDQDLSLELVGVNVPVAEDIEHAITSLIYEGVGLQEIFRDLEPSCFWISENIDFFVAAHSLYLQSGRIEKDELCVILRLERKVADAKYAANDEILPRLDYLIRVLREKEFRRSVISECMSLIYYADNDDFGHDELVEKCIAFPRKVLSGVVVKTPSNNGPFVRKNESEE